MQESDFEAAETTEFFGQCGVERESNGDPDARLRRKERVDDDHMKRVAEPFDLRRLKAWGFLGVEDEALIDRKLCGSFGGQGIGERLGRRPK